MWYQIGMTESVWDPEQYHKFRVERSKPFYDLLDMVRPNQGMRLVDLGCGTGELTWVLHERLDATETLGIDASETMLGKGVAADIDGLAFGAGRIEDFAGEDYHLIFANASLHWIQNHPDLLARLTQLLCPGGQLALQMPANDDHPAYIAADEIAAIQPFASALDGFLRRSPVLPPEQYSSLLQQLGYPEQEVLLRVYLHKLKSREAVLEWARGSFLTAYQSRMEAELFDTFLHVYANRLRKVLPDEKPFLFTFKRLFVWARRGKGSMITL